MESDRVSQTGKRAEDKEKGKKKIFAQIILPRHNQKPKHKSENRNGDIDDNVDGEAKNRPISVELTIAKNCIFYQTNWQAKKSMRKKVQKSKSTK